MSDDEEEDDLDLAQFGRSLIELPAELSNNNNNNNSNSNIYSNSREVSVDSTGGPNIINNIMSLNINTTNNNNSSQVQSQRPSVSTGGIQYRQDGEYVFLL